MRLGNDLDVFNTNGAFNSQEIRFTNALGELNRAQAGGKNAAESKGNSLTAHLAQLTLMIGRDANDSVNGAVPVSNDVVQRSFAGVSRCSGIQ